MKLRPLLIGLFCLTNAAAFAADSPGPLRVVNGDFSDLGGMTQGQDTWYAGLPRGWLGSSGTYAVHAKRGATSPTCNPSNLEPDTVNGMKYLEAVRGVFGSPPKAK